MLLFVACTNTVILKQLNINLFDLFKFRVMINQQENYFFYV